MIYNNILSGRYDPIRAIDLMTTIRQLYDENIIPIEEYDRLWKMKDGDDEMLNLLNVILDAKIAEIGKTRNMYGLSRFRNEIKKK